MSGFGGGFLLGNNGGNNGGYGGGNGGYGGNNGGNGGYGGSYNDNNNYGNSSATKNNNSSPFKGDNRKKGSIIPLTIKKLLEASSRPDDVVEVDGTPVDQAVIIGRAYKLEEQSTRIILHLDDSTGRIQVAYYKKSDTQAQTGLDKYSYEENGYVKAVVVVRPFKTQKMYVSNMLEQIKDFNQISYHFLSTFLASAYRTKGALPKPDPNVQDKLNGTAQKNNNNGTQQGGYQGMNMNLRDQTNNFPVSNNRDPMVVVKDLISKFQHQAVNGYCKQSQLITALKGKMDAHTLDQCLMRLENNAEICRDESNYNDPSFALLGEH